MKRTHRAAGSMRAARPDVQFDAGLVLDGF
jgi:hypothetical protein